MPKRFDTPARALMYMQQHSVDYLVGSNHPNAGRHTGPRLVRRSWLLGYLGDYRQYALTPHENDEALRRSSEIVVSDPYFPSDELCVLDDPRFDANDYREVSAMARAYHGKEPEFPQYFGRVVERAVTHLGAIWAVDSAAIIFDQSEPKAIAVGAVASLAAYLGRRRRIKKNAEAATETINEFRDNLGHRGVWRPALPGKRFSIKIPDSDSAMESENSTYDYQSVRELMNRIVVNPEATQDVISSTLRPTLLNMAKLAEKIHRFQARKEELVKSRDYFQNDTIAQQAMDEQIAAVDAEIAELMQQYGPLIRDLEEIEHRLDQLQLEKQRAEEREKEIARQKKLEREHAASLDSMTAMHTEYLEHKYHNEMAYLCELGFRLFRTCIRSSDLTQEEALELCETIQQEIRGAADNLQDPRQLSGARNRLFAAVQQTQRAIGSKKNQRTTRPSAHATSTVN